MITLVAEPRDLPGVPAGGRHANATLLVLFLSLGGLAFATLQSLVAPALPVIASDLSASTGDISWVLTAYLLAASVFTPILGRLGDMVGKPTPAGSRRTPRSPRVSGCARRSR